MSLLGDTLQRFKDLVVLIEEGITVSPPYECAIAESQLPTFIIKPLGARRTDAESTQMQTDRDFLLLLLVQKTCERKPDDFKTDQDQWEAREACEAYLDSVPRFFKKRRLLEKDNVGLPKIIVVSLFSDNGPQIMAWGGDTYSAILFRTTVTYQESV
jgi:hypothetical protein